MKNIFPKGLSVVLREVFPIIFLTSLLLAPLWNRLVERDLGEPHRGDDNRGHEFKGVP